jgi:hypothetical protein
VFRPGTGHAVSGVSDENCLLKFWGLPVSYLTRFMISRLPENEPTELLRAMVLVAVPSRSVAPVVLKGLQANRQAREYACSRVMRPQELSFRFLFVFRNRASRDGADSQSPLTT